METNTACFIGHRKTNETEDLKIRLWDLIEDFILNQNVTTFLLGSKSDFNNLCEKTLIKTKKSLILQKNRTPPLVWGSLFSENSCALITC